ncbi:MAG: hypothetical protein AAF950_10255 [Pseudomonadota bacterium]
MTKIFRYLAAITMILLAASATASAQEYTHGNGALELFDNEGVANSPAWVRAWVFIMLGAFALGLLFVWKRLEARVVVGGFILGIVSMILLQSAFGIPPLSGFIALMHLIFWTPGLILLLQRRTFLSERSLYGAWTGLMTFVILFSFVFDIRDAAIYLDHIAGTGLLS